MYLYICNLYGLQKCERKKGKGNTKVWRCTRNFAFLPVEQSEKEDYLSHPYNQVNECACKLSSQKCIPNGSISGSEVGSKRWNNTTRRFLNFSKKLYNDYTNSLVLSTDNNLVIGICQALW